jgi:hypothetical protein
MDETVRSIKEFGLEMTQAKRVIGKFGGPSRMARSLEEVSGARVFPSVVSSWALRGGFIPAQYHELVFEAAERSKVRLTIEDFSAFPAGHPIFKRRAKP